MKARTLAISGFAALLLLLLWRGGKFGLLTDGAEKQTPTLVFERNDKDDGANLSFGWMHFRLSPMRIIEVDGISVMTANQTEIDAMIGAIKPFIVGGVISMDTRNAPHGLAEAVLRSLRDAGIATRY